MFCDVLYYIFDVERYNSDIVGKDIFDRTLSQRDIGT